MEKPITLSEHKKTKKEVAHANRAYKKNLTFNDHVLGGISDVLGSPWVVYLFTIIALVGLTQVANLMELVQWFSQTFVQFVALAIIQGRSNIQSRFDEARAEMTYQLAKENEKDIHLLLEHQDYQNEQIDRLIETLEKSNKKEKETASVY
jgi:low affinity Fe/Cu permease